MNVVFICLCMFMSGMLTLEWTCICTRVFVKFVAVMIFRTLWLLFKMHGLEKKLPGKLDTTTESVN